jgi:hypothetical protein
MSMPSNVPAATGPQTPAAAPYVFMVGVERSGTTILRTMLDMHSRLAMTPESYFPVEWLRPHLRRVYEQGGAGDTVDTVDTALLLAELGKHEWFAKWGLPLEAVETAWQTNPPRTVPDALSELYGAYGAAEGKELVGDKTPAFVWEIPLLAAAFPTARFIHVVRDGRDVALAFKALEHRPPDTLPDGVIYWRNHVRAGRRFGEAIPGRYTEVRYEDLLDDPQRELEKLCGFLGLGFEGQLLDYQSKAEATAATYVGPDVHANLRKPLRKGLRDWRRDVPNSELAVLQRLGGSALADFGYDTTPLPSGVAGLKVSALAAAAEARFQATRYRNTLLRRLRQPAERRALRDSGDQQVPTSSS